MVLNKTRPSPWPNRAAGLLLLALVVQAGWISGSLGVRILSPAVAVAPVYTGEEQGSSISSILSDISVSDLDLFGSSSSTLEVPAAISQNAPDTNLRLILSGVAMARRPEDSSAIVAAGSGAEVEWYRIGDTLPGNAQLVEVQQDRILIRREGRVETLRFPAEDEQGALAVAYQSQGQSAPQSTEEFVAEAQSRLSEDPTGTLAAVGFKPRDNDGASGYVYDGSNPMLNAMNLRTGDVVLAVNGHALGDMRTDRELIQQWSEQSELQIEVERNSSRFSVVVPIP